MLIDTHAHLWWESYDSDLDLVLRNASLVNVKAMIVPGTNLFTSRLAIDLAKKYPGLLYAAVGVHPEETTTNNFQFDIVDLQKLVSENTSSVVAIGEIGIDLFTDDVKQKLKEQEELFKSQLLLANEFNLPVIIHTRNSFDETWSILKTLPKMPRGQFHCFSIDEEALKNVLANNFYVSFGGNITWSKRVAKLVSMVPDNRLLLETDSPLMVPRDKKGVAVGENERNEPANIKYLAGKIGELRGQTSLEIAEVTTLNAKTLYKL